jgi:predicted nucleic acid-binding protein
MAGLTFDAGALMALQGKHSAIRKVFDAATTGGVVITVPAVVIAEWWRAPGGWAEKTLLPAVEVQEMSRGLAKAAGLGLAAVGEKLKSRTVVCPQCRSEVKVSRGRNALTIDAIVMASAAERGDTVYTSDPEDMLILKEHFARVAGVERA